MYVSFREQIETKERRNKTTEVSSGRYTHAGDIFSRDPSKESQESKLRYGYSSRKWEGGGINTVIGAYVQGGTEIQVVYPTDLCIFQQYHYNLNNQL